MSNSNSNSGLNPSQSKVLVILGLLIGGIVFGVGPFGGAKCSRDKQSYSNSPSFTGSLHCTKCNCKSWGGGNNYNSPCPNQGCHHKYTEHR